MTDRFVHNPKETELVNKSIVLTSVKDAENFGLTSSDIGCLCHEVSYTIDQYNHENNSEMLPKSPEIIYNQLSNGLSCMIVSDDKDQGRWRILYHGSIYPVFEDGEDKILGTQIVEFGSSITQKDFRVGFGLGTKGIETRYNMMKKLSTENVQVFGISTVKRLVTGHAFDKFGIHPVSFWKHPYTAFLTNTCEKSSERFGNEKCDFRRPIESSGDEELAKLFVQIKDNGYLPCTLIATDHEAIARFEARCRDLHQDMGGVPILANEISVDSYKRSSEFFSRIKEYAKTK